MTRRCHFASSDSSPADRPPARDNIRQSGWNPRCYKPKAARRSGADAALRSSGTPAFSSNHRVRL
jgi:hypothetical protein